MTDDDDREDPFGVIVLRRSRTEPPDFECACGAKGWVEKGKSNDPWECPYCGLVAAGPRMER